MMGKLVKGESDFKTVESEGTINRRGFLGFLGTIAACVVVEPLSGCYIQASQIYPRSTGSLWTPEYRSSVVEYLVNLEKRNVHVISDDSIPCEGKTITYSTISDILNGLFEDARFAVQERTRYNRSELILKPWSNVDLNIEPALMVAQSCQVPQADGCHTRTCYGNECISEIILSDILTPLKVFDAGTHELGHVIRAEYKSDEDAEYFSEGFGLYVSLIVAAQNPRLAPILLDKFFGHLGDNNNRSIEHDQGRIVAVKRLSDNCDLEASIYDALNSNADECDRICDQIVETGTESRRTVGGALYTLWNGLLNQTDLTGENSFASYLINAGHCNEIHADELVQYLKLVNHAKHAEFSNTPEETGQEFLAACDEFLSTSTNDVMQDYVRRFSDMP
jgi:hypothetical protein